MPNSNEFFNSLEVLLKQAAGEEEVIEDLGTAEEDISTDEELPELADAEDVVDSGEEAFAPVLAPSNWEVKESGGGYVVFEKTDSQSDPKAMKGRYDKSMVMDTGKPDESIIDYIRAFLKLNGIDFKPMKHLTRRTPTGPETKDEYDRDVAVTYEWQDGKYRAKIEWRPADQSIKVPPQFEKDVPIPDELAPQEEEVSEAPVEEEIPSLDEVEEDIGEEEGLEEGLGEEEEPGLGEEEEEEEVPEEEAEASAVIRLKKISSALFRRGHYLLADKVDHAIALVQFAAPEDEEEGLEGLDEEEPADEEPVDEAETDPADEDEVEEDIPDSADMTQVVNGILETIRDNGKTVFQDYIEGEALQTGVLYPRDFKDLNNFRDEGETDKLRDKELAMADRVHGDIDRILKAEAPSADVKDKIAEMPPETLDDIVADNLEFLSSSDTDGSLTQDLQSTDIAEGPDDPSAGVDEIEEVEETTLSDSEQLVNTFYQMRGSMTPGQRRSVPDITLLEMAREKMDAERQGDVDKVADDDFEKAKQLISDDLEGRGDLLGNA